jgi:hypothetical protein
LSLSFAVVGVGFIPGFGLLSLAVEAPLAVPFGIGSGLLLFNGRFFVEVAGFPLFAGGGGVGGEFTVFTAGLTGSGLGLLVKVGLVVAGFGGLLVVGVTGVVFLTGSVFSAGFLGYIFEAVVAVVLVEVFFYKLGTLESFLLISNNNNSIYK